MVGSLFPPAALVSLGLMGGCDPEGSDAGDDAESELPECSGFDAEAINRDTGNDCVYEITDAESGDLLGTGECDEAWSRRNFLSFSASGSDSTAKFSCELFPGIQQAQFEVSSGNDVIQLPENSGCGAEARFGDPLFHVETRTCGFSWEETAVEAQERLDGTFALTVESSEPVCQVPWQVQYRTHGSFVAECGSLPWDPVAAFDADPTGVVLRFTF